MLTTEARSGGNELPYSVDDGLYCESRNACLASQSASVSLSLSLVSLAIKCHSTSKPPTLHPVLPLYQLQWYSAPSMSAPPCVMALSSVAAGALPFCLSLSRTTRDTRVPQENERRTLVSLCLSIERSNSFQRCCCSRDLSLSLSLE